MPYFSIHSAYQGTDTYSLFSVENNGNSQLKASNISSAYVGTIIACYNNNVSTSKLLGPEYIRKYDFENSITAIFNANLPAFSTKELYFQYRFLIGDELVLVRYIESLGNKRYSLSGFSRDRFGYNPIAYTSHARIGETILFINDAIGYADIDTNAQTIMYARSSNNVANKSISTFIIPQNPNRLCLPPANVEANRSGNDLVITLNRRDRIDNSWATSGDAALSESQEKYGIDILSTDYAVLRTLTATNTSSITYTEAQQITDFGAVKPNYIIHAVQYNSNDEKGYYTLLNYDDSPEYYNNMESETIGIQLSNTTKTWDTTGVSYNIISGKYLDFVQATPGNKALKFDDKINIRNSEVLIKFRIPTTGGFSVVFRGKDDVSGLVFNINNTLTTLKYSYYTAGVEGSATVTKAKDIEANLWYFLKLKVYETLVFAKVWKVHRYEPKDWDISSMLDIERESGWIGLGQNVSTSETEISDIRIKSL